MTQSRRAEKWLSQGVNDARHARYALNGGFHAQACYSAQQAVEKSLKALMLEAGQELERTHSVLALQRLLQDAGVTIPEDVLSQDEGRLLARMHVETWYPLGDADDAPFELFGETDARQATAIADRVVDFVSDAMDHT